jgi:hypothetical protein
MAKPLFENVRFWPKADAIWLNILGEFQWDHNQKRTFSSRLSITLILSVYLF